MSNTTDMVEIYHKLHAQINELDEVLDAQTADAAAAGKRKITNDLIATEEASWKPIVEQLQEMLSKLPANRQIGVYFGLVRALGGAFSTSLNAELDKLVAEQPVVEVEKLDPEKVKQIAASRSELAKNLSNLVTTMTNFGLNVLPDGTEMVTAKKRTGGRGPRGKRALSFFTWSVGDKTYENLRLFVEDTDIYEKVAALTAAMRDAKIDTKNPGDRIEFTLPDGNVLVGVKGEGSSSDDDDSEEDTDVDSDEDTDSDEE